MKLNVEVRKEQMGLVETRSQRQKDSFDADWALLVPRPSRPPSLPTH